VSVVQLPENQEWYARVKAAVDAYNKILGDANFAGGSDLTPQQMDDMFGHMKELSHDRALSNLLYKDNEVKTFNAGLRTLLYGPGSLADRVNKFVELKWVREVVASHFLCLRSPQEFPFFSWQTYEMLELAPEQEEEAARQALTEQAISDPKKYSEITLDYLQHLVVFRGVKELLQLESYPLVNVILWDASKARDEGLTAPVPLSSVSLEKDLQHYIAMNPWVIEKGLELAPDGEEYHTTSPDVGDIDVLLKAKSGDYIVVETKKGRENDKVVGQIMRYMGWVSRNLGKCRGVIVVAEKDERLEYAAVPLTGNLRIKKYEVKFELSDV
jgi:hypothetical protein